VIRAGFSCVRAVVLEPLSDFLDRWQRAFHFSNNTRPICIMSLIYTVPSEGSQQKRRNSLYLGGQTEAKDISTLQRFGIQYIVNVTPEKEAGITVRFLFN
jgi:hypothetical protein